jgi:peptidoglycan/xylan/chitin deacetylase (PgdA/CDA1 family)
MTERIHNVLLGVCLLVVTNASAQFLTNSVINGSSTPKRSVFLTFDDGADEPGPDGLTEIQKVATYLQGPITFNTSGPRSSLTPGFEKSIRASFAIVACHFIGQDKANPNSSMCQGYGDVPESIAADVIASGHDIFNHSQNHLPLTGIETNPAEVIYEVGHAQIEIDKIRDNSPRLFRAPGLAWDATIGGILNGDPSTNTITGPVDADVGGAFQIDLGSGMTWIGGDWDCVALNLTVPVCGDLYVDGIKQASHGVVVLLHVRTEDMSGRNGNPYPLELAKYIVEHLGPEYEYLPLDAIPGVHGAISTAPATKVSADFTASDGQGIVVAGAIQGAGKPVSICKARGSTVVCMDANGHGGFGAESPRFTITDPTWFASYNSAFWLEDIDGDGLADLIYPTAQCLWVAFNNGNGGFQNPVVFYWGEIPDPHFVRFAQVAGSGRPDMVVWAPGATAASVYWNNGARFVPPAGATSWPQSITAGVNPTTMQLIDINGDGRADLVVRGSGQVQCAISAGLSFGSLQPCSIAGGPFAQSGEWWNLAYAGTFAVANINGPVLVDGQPSGVIFSPLSASGVSNRFRYLCNNCFTNAAELDWKPELRASQIVWADFTGSGIDSPLFVRTDGLYLALTQH